VHDALRDPLVIEVRDLLAEVEVLEERRAAFARPEAVLVVLDGNALVGRQRLARGMLEEASEVVGLGVRGRGRSQAVDRAGITTVAVPRRVSRSRAVAIAAVRHRTPPGVPSSSARSMPRGTHLAGLTV
jgi:hypothetical protein